ncbi:MAG TPA: hypothetical protein PL048_21155 [Leptospiraceae bacterium]|nr:hypothetical protein [Leptospiraceae bacterium]HMY66611.1 hypothetical protein [Leptospiraceae bacterium]HMZ61294.1 hypothetical protein [Leptospiraceae bacterium]HNF14554.1 hypothetical protein [Leptospiraceae bacterium]HNH10305.1 hypothetical protein [Leptospiraceae bacterium]
MRGFTDFIRISLFLCLILFSGCTGQLKLISGMYIEDYYHPDDIIGIYNNCKESGHCRIGIKIKFRNRQGMTRIGLSELQTWNSKNVEKYYWLESPSESGAFEQGLVLMNTVQRRLKKLEVPLRKNGVILDFSGIFQEKQQVIIPFEKPVNSELDSVTVSEKKDFLRFRYADRSDVYYKNIYHNKASGCFEYKIQHEKPDFYENTGFKVRKEILDFRKSLLLNLNDRLILVQAENLDFSSAGRLNVPHLTSNKKWIHNGLGDYDRHRENSGKIDLSFLYALELLFRISQILK